MAHLDATWRTRRVAWRQGPQGGSPRVDLLGGGGRRLHRAGLQPGCHPRVRRHRHQRATGPDHHDLAFIPMLFISYAYKEMNYADPDCGTTFTWGTRAFGPTTGWFGGWGIVVADILVMASLAQIAGQYVFLLFGADGIGVERRQRLGAPGRNHVDRGDDGDLLRRHRDLGEPAEGPARHRADDPACVLPSSHW